MVREEQEQTVEASGDAYLIATAIGEVAAAFRDIAEAIRLLAHSPEEPDPEQTLD